MIQEDVDHTTYMLRFPCSKLRENLSLGTTTPSSLNEVDNVNRRRHEMVMGDQEVMGGRERSSVGMLQFLDWADELLFRLVPTATLIACRGNDEETWIVVTDASSKRVLFGCYLNLLQGGLDRGEGWE